MPLAQINAASGLWIINDQRLSGFVDNLENINAIDDASAGFLWRLQDDAGDATNIQVFNDHKKLVNMSMWSTIEDLITYAYKTADLAFIKQRSSGCRNHQASTCVCRERLPKLFQFI